MTVSGMPRRVRNSRAPLFVFVLVVLALCGVTGPGPAAAQQGLGTILGTVTDTTGAALPGASVEVKNLGTGFAVSLNSNQDGAFSAPNLLVGLQRQGDARRLQVVRPDGHRARSRSEGAGRLRRSRSAR